MTNVEKKTAFVTGGAQGLGHGFVQRFLEEGANVCYGDVNETLGRSTEQELQSKYGKERVIFFPCDVSDDEKFEEAFTKAVSSFGHIDIMVNNAGVLNEGLWKKMIQVNITGVVRGTGLAMDHMRKDKGGKGGRIINISSLVGLVDVHSLPVYNGTKHFVRSYTSSLAMTEGLVSDLGIEMAILCPDITKTGMMANLDNTKFLDYDKFKDILDQLMNPVSVVVDGMFSLLHKDSINGAILLANKEGFVYQKMEKVSLGTEWPLPKKD